MFRRLIRLRIGVIAAAAITMGVAFVPASGVTSALKTSRMASAAQIAPHPVIPLSSTGSLTEELIDVGNTWALDGRENCCGGVHMAPPDSDGNYQMWDVSYNSNTGYYTFTDVGNKWTLDGRENCCGGVHVAPPGSDGNTQLWRIDSHDEFVNVGNKWALDGRENCCGGVHMAPPDSDGNTQVWGGGS